MWVLRDRGSQSAIGLVAVGVALVPLGVVAWSSDHKAVASVLLALGPLVVVLGVIGLIWLLLHGESGAEQPSIPESSSTVSVGRGGSGIGIAGQTVNIGAINQGNRAELAEVQKVHESVLQVEPAISREFRSGARAFLRVSNPSGDEIRNCYGRLSRLVWAMSYSHNGEVRISYRTLFSDRDIYFRWQGVGERRHTFHSGAILEIAASRYGEGQGGWTVHPDTPAPRPISFFEDYFLSVQLGAEERRSQMAHFRVKIYSESRRVGNEIYLEPIGTPPHLEFETIDESAIPDPDADDLYG